MRKNQVRLFYIIIGFLSTLNSLAIVNVITNPNGLKYSSVLLNGSTTSKYDIVFIGDGFTSSETDQAKFNSAVDIAVNALRSKQPYMNYTCAFNIWRVNVVSKESGIDHPLSHIDKNTELDCSFGDNVSHPERVIFSSTPMNLIEAANFAPAYEAIYIIVNDTADGGAAGEFVFTSLSSDMSEVIVHELGHFIGKLADEYDCYFCDGRVEPPYTGAELSAENVTIEKTRSKIKWNSIISALTPIPTITNSPIGVVGLWEGGYYSSTGVFRPQQNCLMKNLGYELCNVCKNVLTKKLKSYCTITEGNTKDLNNRISQLREMVNFSKPTKYLIPECTFCPLNFDRTTELELSIDSGNYSIKISDENSRDIETSVNKANNKTIISFIEKPDTRYFLTILPLFPIETSENVNLKLMRNGQKSALF